MTFEINVDGIGDLAERLGKRIERAANRIKRIDFDKLEGLHDRVIERIERGVERVDWDRIGERIERGVERLGRIWDNTKTGPSVRTIVLEIKSRGSRIRLALSDPMNLRLPEQASKALEAHGLDWNDIQALFNHELPEGPILEITTHDFELGLSIQEHP